MIKIFFIVIPAMILFIASPFLNDEKVRVTQEVKHEVKPGETFNVKLTVHRVNISGFARLQQYLPEGFTAEEIESHGADFIFEENSVKFNWLKLPDEEEFTIEYRIKTDQALTGKKTITGVFVYIDGDKTQRLEIAPENILMKETSPSSAMLSPEITRRIIIINKETGEYRVELTFHPNGNKEAAKFSDEIPARFSAEAIDAHQSSFSFENNAAVFNWSNLPDEKEFLVTYRVSSGKAGAVPEINGALVYGNLSSGTTGTESSAPQNEIKESTVQVSTTIPETITADNSSTETEKAEYIPVSQKGITFRVQISATKYSTTKSNDWFNAKYHINTPVELTNHEGWKKYLVGNFEAYNEATVFRKQTQDKVSDAFIVAYQNGVRIPVNEAIKNKSLNQ